MSWDEISTVSDVASELLAAGDPRGNTLKTLVQEYASSAARTEEEWSIKVPPNARRTVLDVIDGGNEAA